MTGPEKRTKAFFEKEYGALVGNVSCYNAHIRRYRDLFGIFDFVVIGVAPWPTLYVQATSGSNHAARRAKMAASGLLRDVLRAGNGVALVSWKKSRRTKNWEPRIEMFWEGDLEDAAKEDG